MNPQCSMWFWLYMSSLWTRSWVHFCLTVANLLLLEEVTKRALVSDIARSFDVLGWFPPAIVQVKILPQRLWGMRCSCATSNYTSGGESCSSFCLVTFPDATTTRMSKSYPCSCTVLVMHHSWLRWCSVLEDDWRTRRHSHFYGNLWNQGGTGNEVDHTQGRFVWSSCNLSTIIIARWCLVFLLIRYFLGLTAR